MKVFNNRCSSGLLVLSFAVLMTSNSEAALFQKQSLPNFYQVNEQLYRGGKPTEAGLKQLSEMGVKTIIDLQGGDLNSYWNPIVHITERGELASSISLEREQAEALGLNFKNFPLDSIDRVDANEDAMINEILKDFQDPSLQPIYVHCQHGKDRTGLLIALERIKYEQWSVEDARSEWIAFGHKFMSRIFTGALDRYFYSLDLVQSAPSDADVSVEDLQN